MIKERRTERIARFVKWIVERAIVIEIAILVVVVLAGCSAAIPLPTPTAEPATATVLDKTTSAKETSQPTTSPTLAATSCTVKTGVPAGFLNLRTGPGTEYAVIRVLSEGERLQIVTWGDWNEVTATDGVSGYVNSNYCR